MGHVTQRCYGVVFAAVCLLAVANSRYASAQSEGVVASCAHQSDEETWSEVGTANAALSVFMIRSRAD